MAKKVIKDEGEDRQSKIASTLKALQSKFGEGSIMKLMMPSKSSGIRGATCPWATFIKL